MLKETKQFLIENYKISEKAFEIYDNAMEEINETLKEYDKIISN